MSRSVRVDVSICVSVSVTVSVRVSRSVVDIRVAHANVKRPIIKMSKNKGDTW